MLFSAITLDIAAKSDVYSLRYSRFQRAALLVLQAIVQKAASPEMEQSQSVP